MSNTHNGSRRLSPLRRWAYRIMTLAIVLVIGEFLAFGVMVFWEGQYDHFTINQKRRGQISGFEQDDTEDTNAAAGVKIRFEKKDAHPYLGYTADPDRSTLYSEYGFPRQSYFKVGDNFRYRGNGIDLPRRTKGRFIIAILGGSVAKQFTDRAVSTLVEKLRSHPDFRQMEIRVVPLALGGYKQPQQLLTINYFLSLGAEFDLIINLDGFNEVALHEAENGKKGIFYAYPRSWVKYTSNIPDEKLFQLYKLGQQRELWARLGSTWPLSYSSICNLIWRLGDRLLEYELRSTRESYLDERPSGKPLYKVTGPNRQYSNRKELFQDLVGTWERSSIQLHRLSAENKINYFHFLQPNQYVRNSKPMSSEERAIAIREDQPYRPGALAGYPLLLESGERIKSNGVRFYDLTDVFAEHPGPVYRDDCCHLTTEGYEIVAKRIAGDIIDSGIRSGNSE